MSDARRCRTCKKSKPKSEFYANRSRLDGLQVSCKPCDKARAMAYAKANPKKTKVIRDRWRSQNSVREREHARKSKLKLGYGLTLEAHAEMVRKQRGRCRICRRKFKTPIVDHCHKTGKVRGLLCHSCNVGLGHFRDSPELLQKAIEYLS